MSRLIRWVLPALALLGLLVAVILFCLMNSYREAPVDPAWTLQGGTLKDDTEADSGAVTVRFTGTTTLLFSDGLTHWMTDGWFSRPGPLRLLLGKIEPDLAAIEEGLAANDVTELAAVFPLHSHYDHAMDASEVARRTGALLLGSESTANIGRGWGLPESRIRVVRDREPITLGLFVITPIESRHFLFSNPALRERLLSETKINQPLAPPVAAFDYRVGKAYILHVAHPRGSWLVVGSAGYEERALAGLVADTVLLGVGALGSQSEDYRETFWRETVEAVSARRVIPIHFDSLTGPIEGPFTGLSHAMALLSGGDDDLYRFIKRKEAVSPGLVINTLPRYRETVLFR